MYLQDTGFHSPHTASRTQGTTSCSVHCRTRTHCSSHPHVPHVPHDERTPKQRKQRTTSISAFQINENPLHSEPTAARFPFPQSLESKPAPSIDSAETPQWFYAALRMEFPRLEKHVYIWETPHRDISSLRLSLIVSGRAPPKATKSQSLCSAVDFSAVSQNFFVSGCLLATEWNNPAHDSMSPL